MASTSKKEEGRTKSCLSKLDILAAVAGVAHSLLQREQAGSTFDLRVEANAQLVWLWESAKPDSSPVMATAASDAKIRKRKPLQRQTRPDQGQSLPRMPPPPQQEKWEEAHAALLGSPPVLFGEKQMFPSEIKRQQGRLLLLKGIVQRIMAMVEPEEMELIKTVGLRVLTLDWLGRHYDMYLKHWHSSNSTVLVGKWMKLVNDCGLEELVDKYDVRIKIYGFRTQQNDLCFVLVI